MKKRNINKYFKFFTNFIRTPAFWGVFILIILFLLFSAIVAVRFGSVNISKGDIIRIVLNKLLVYGNISNMHQSTIDIIWNIRFPRVLLALVAGSGLAVSGVIMQASVKNSLADPYILGISSGAALGATLAILLGVGINFGSNYVGVSACIGAFLSSLLVLVLANIKGRAGPIKLIMSGVAVSSMFSAFSSFIIYTSKNRDGMRDVHFWLMGGLSGAKWENMPVVSITVALAIVFLLTQYRVLNLMLLGDDVSITLGKDLNQYRKLYMLVASIMTGFIVYNVGIIGFVGLIIPHIARVFFGTDHKKVIPVSAALGAIILIWADVMSRIVVKGTEIPVGIIVSLVGAPTFLYLLINKEYGFGGGK